MPLIGFGSKLEFGNGDGPPETFTELAGTEEIDTGSSATDAVESTTMGAASRFRTYNGGLSKAGDVTVKGYFDPTDASQTSFIALQDGALHNFKILYPGGASTESFSGLLVSFDVNRPLAKNCEFTAKITISGAVTRA